MSLVISFLALEITGAVFVFMVMLSVRSGCGLSELMPLSFLTGTGIAAYQLFVYHLAGVRFTFQSVSMIPLIFVLLAGFFLVFKRADLKQTFLFSRPLEGATLLEKLLFAGVVLQILWVLFLVLPVPVHSHDAVANYALKAKIFYFNQGMPAHFLNWPEEVIAHPDYPLLLPFLMTWIYEFTGFNDFLVNLVMPLIYVAFLALFYALMKKFFKRAYSMLIVFFLATVPQLADYATVIHADLIFTAFITCAFIYFVTYMRNTERAALVFSSVLFGVSLWVKNEAMVFVAAFFMALIIFCIKTSRRAGKFNFMDIFVAFVIIAVIAAPWFCLKISAGAVNSDMDLSKVTMGSIWQNVKDIPVLLNLFQQEVFGPKKWNIFWILVFGCAIWKHKSLWKGEVFYITFFLLVSAIGYFAAYMCITGGDLYFYVNTTISRFMLHFTGVAAFLLANLIWDDARVVMSRG